MWEDLFYFRIDQGGSKVLKLLACSKSIGVFILRASRNRSFNTFSWCFLHFEKSSGYTSVFGLFLNILHVGNMCHIPTMMLLSLSFNRTFSSLRFLKQT